MTDTRSSSALFKRAEQMKRWEESETNRQPPIPRKASRIKFSSGCVFLAACTAGEKEEVQRLLKMGADINTANVDGLTALHQACIDDNLDMVEFLVSKGADVNCGDNEGWTPLHATASCGFISMARFLLESGADVGAVNYDGDLPVDIAESDEMENLLKKVINEKGIDCDYARNAEERTMLAHAQNWAATGEYMDLQHPKTGATPLHVAAAKGYTKIVSLLLNECNVDVDALDFDGWTSLHAAALWGQKESAELLIQHGADMDIKNYSGQTCFDLVDPDIAQWLEEMRKTLGTTNNNNNTNSNKHKRGPPAPRDPPNNKLKRVEVQITNQATKDKLDPDNRRSLDPKIQSPTITSPTQPVLDAKPPKAKAPSPETPVDEQIGNSSPEKNATLATDDPPSWRRSASFRSRQNDTANTRDNKLMSTSPPNSGTDTILRRTHSFENDKTFYQRYLEVTARIKASSCPSLPPIPQSSLTALDVILKKRSQNDNEITPKDKIIEDVQYRSPQTERRDAENYAWILSPSGAMRSSVESLESQTSNSTPPTPVGPATTPAKLSPGNIFKNFFKSLVPPIRDEESETQRKAHAKRVRETRRSTQGVTLDEIKSAEQFVKKKTNNVLGNSATPANNNNVTSAEVNIAAPNGIKKTTPAGTTYSTCSSTTSSNVLTDTTASNNARAVSDRLCKSSDASNTLAVTLPLGGVSVAPSITASATIAATGCSERRPSWRLRVDPGCKFELEEVNKANAAAAAAAAAANNPRAPSPRLSAATVTTNTADTTVTLPLRRQSTSSNKDGKGTNAEEEKEVSPETRATTQAALNVIQRRRRPKRRSTGVGHVDMDDIVNDRGGGGEGDTESESIISQSGTDSKEDTGSKRVSNSDTPTENGAIDYKALWEASQAEVKKLKEIMKSNDQQLRDARATIERVTHVSQNSLTELEKREKRAMERKLSEMEEELKLQQALQAENQRLKDENGALIRVISKLSK